jgi:hypothetical protein
MLVLGVLCVVDRPGESLYELCRGVIGVEVH